MVKQDQNQSPQPDQARKQAQVPSQGFPKQKGLENRQSPNGQDDAQDPKSQENNKKSSQQEKRQSNDFDRNEGQGRSQKS